MNTLQKIFDRTLLVLTALAVIVMLVCAYYKLFVKETTIGINLVGDQVGVDVVLTEDLTKEEIKELTDRQLFEVNVYSNDAGNGMRMVEVKLNYFTTYELKNDNYRGVGVQVLSDYNPKVGNEDSIGAIFLDGVFNTKNSNQKKFIDEYREKYGTWPTARFDVDEPNNNIAFSSTSNLFDLGGYVNTTDVNTPLTSDTKFFIKHEGKAYAIAVDKTYDRYQNYGILNGIFNWTAELVNGGEYKYTFGHVFQALINAVESQDYIDGYMTVNLSKYITVYGVSDDGVIYEDNVTDEIVTYATVKFHHDEQGVTSPEQSIFGTIPGWEHTKTEDINYSYDRTIYTFNAKDLSYRYSATYGGYFVSLDLKDKELLKNAIRSEAIINLDLNSKWLIDNKINVVGIDVYAFSELNIEKFNITGKEQTLTVLEGAFDDAVIYEWAIDDGITFEGFSIEEVE